MWKPGFRVLGLFGQHVSAVSLNKKPEDTEYDIVTHLARVRII